MVALARPAPAGAANDNPPSQPFVTRDAAGLCHLELAVPDMHCASCIRVVERALTQLDGVEHARVNLSNRHVNVAWRGTAQNDRSIVEALDSAGFAATPIDAADAAGEAADEGRFLLRCLGVAAFAAGNVMLFSVAVWGGFGEMSLATRTAFYLLSALIAVPATLYAGLPFYRSAGRALARGRANMDVPISIAVLSALILSLYQTAIGAPYAYFDASVTLLFFLLIGRYLDQLLRYRTRGATRALLALQSATARRLNRQGNVTMIAARDIAAGDLLVVMPGERVPVDAVVRQGVSDLDVSLVSGEPDPHPARVGQAVGAGALNLSAPLTIAATATVETSLVAELARLVEAGEQNRGRYVRLADVAARWYVPIIHTVAFGVFIGWWAFSADGLMAAMHNAIATLIITCPCGLGLAVPATQVVAVGRLLRGGILVKSGDALERLAEIDTVVFDKTGTLTTGTPTLQNADELGGAIIADAARLARASRHPLSMAIAAHAGAGPLLDEVREIPGLGLEGRHGGALWRLGRADWVCGGDSSDRGGPLELWFRRGTETPHCFRFGEMLRPDVRDVLDGLRRRRLRIHLVSGDSIARTSAMASDLGIKHWHGEIQPFEKAGMVRRIAADGRKVLMIGDGLNDAAALASAHASMAPSSAADATQNAADVILTGPSLSPMLLTLDVARHSRRRIMQGFGFAAIYNVVALPFGAAGLVTPVISAVAMSASSLAVTLNALRPYPRFKP